MRTPRLTYIVDHLHLAHGGTENQLFKIIPALAAGFGVQLICLRENDWLKAQVGRLRCPVSFQQISNFKAPVTYRNWWRLVNQLRSSAPDVVHTFFPVANIVGVLAARAAGVRYVVASRRDFGEWMSRRYLFGTRIANHYVDRIVTNSMQVKLLTQRVEKFPPERIEVIWNGIDLQAVTRSPPALDLRRSLGIPDADAVVILVANFRPMKRHSTLVEAARRVLGRRTDVSFLLVGADYNPGEPLKKAVRQLARELGVADKFFYAHAKDDVVDYLSFADVGVNCSYGEGISNAVMEYMACGLPCIVAASGGNRDLVADGSTGLLFEVGRADQLADRILAMLERPEEAAALAARAREVLRARTSMDAMTASFRKFYLDLINGHPRNAVAG